MEGRKKMKRLISSLSCSLTGRKKMGHKGYVPQCDGCWVRNLGTSLRRDNQHEAGKGRGRVAQRLPRHLHLNGLESSRDAGKGRFIQP